MPYKDHQKALECWRKREQKAERIAYRRAYANGAARQRYSRKWIWQRYGLLESDYFRLLAKQNGGCALCGKKPKEGKVLNVDHCHETGKVRGLLCSGCNVGLGRFGDSPEQLRKAIQYLESHDEIE